MLIKIEKNVQKNTLKSWKYNFVICAPHSVSCAPLPHSPPYSLAYSEDNCELHLPFLEWASSRAPFDRPLCASRDSSVNDICGQAEGRKGVREGGGQQQGGATHNRATRPGQLVCHLRRHQAQSLDQAQDRSCVVQMTYKNLIFNNTNQFKNHQRHKNSFAGA